MPSILLKILHKLSHKPQKYKGGSQKPCFTTWPELPGSKLLYWTLYSKWANDNAFPGNLDLKLLFLLHSVSWTKETKARKFFVVLRTSGNSDCSENYSINIQKEAKVKDRKSYSSMSSCQMPSYTPYSLWNPSNLKYFHLVKLVYVSLFS